MNNTSLRYGISIISAICILLSGCNMLTSMTDRVNSSTFSSICDYSDWYYDINNTSVYNCVQWIELDIWLKERASNYDFSEVSFDVSYNGQSVATNQPIDIDICCMKCYFGNSNEGAILSNKYLAPGEYEIDIKNTEGDLLYSSICTVTIMSGEVLAEMVDDVVVRGVENRQVIIQVNFKTDITPYTKEWFYITASQEGELLSVYGQYTVEIADTYIIIKYNLPVEFADDILISVYSGDGIWVCEKKIET